MTDLPHILVADWHAPEFDLEAQVLREQGMTWSLPPRRETPLSDSEQEALLLERIAAAPRIDGVLFLLAPLTARVIQALPRECRHLQRVGIGLDKVDLEAVRTRGLSLDNTPDYATEEVAVHAMAMILSLHRQLSATQAQLLAGHWQVVPPAPVERLSTLSLGLIGLGRIGLRLALLMRPLVKEVLYHDPAVTGVPEPFQPVSLQELLRSADIVSLHCPLLPQTRGLISSQTLGWMKPGAMLINVARGGLVDAEALAEALRAGRLSGAGLDVFEPEVLPSDSPLRRFNNVILTSHTAWYSRQSVLDCRTQAIRKMVDALRRP
jgi:D-3-phosphoglycerate dehydrogenase / 2-oxoglutarate reductase